jgi:hypothetical protein
MKKVKIILAACMIGMLIACAGPTMAQLKARPTNTYSFERNIEYTKAYDLTREYIEMFFLKYQGPISGFGVTHDLYSDQKYGEVGTEFHDAITNGPSYKLTCHIAQIEDGKTKIDVYSVWGFGSHGKMLEKYIDEHMNPNKTNEQMELNKVLEYTRPDK